MSGEREKIDSSRPTKSLWKRIGYVKANGNMSETDNRGDSNDRSHMHSGDKKHSYYNSMIQQKPAQPQTSAANPDPQSDENAHTDHHDTIHNDPALKDMLEQFKAMEMEEEMIQATEKRNPLAQSMDDVKY